MKITIVGAGLLGVTSAYFLAKDGHEVTVVDRQEGPALETSFANAGMLTPSMSDPWNSPGILGTVVKNLGNPASGFLLRLKALPSLIGWGLQFLLKSSEKQFLKNMHVSADMSFYSVGILNELREELNLKYDALNTGAMKIFRNQSSMDEYAKLARHLGEHNMQYKIVAPDELVEIEPSLETIKDELCGGIYYPDDEAGNAYKYTIELAKHAETMGVNFRYGVTVERIIRNGSNIEKLITSDGDLTADKYVLCAGSFSPLLARDVGLNVPVRPAKGYSISVPITGWNMGPKMPIVDDDFHGAITPLGNTLRIAGTAELTGYDDTLTQSRIDNLYNFLEGIYPDLSAGIKKVDVAEWSGFRPMTTDGVPIIGETPIQNLYLNTGHGPLGWTMAAGSAKMLSDLIAERQTVLNSKNYSFARF